MANDEIGGQYVTMGRLAARYWGHYSMCFRSALSGPHSAAAPEASAEYLLPPKFILLLNSLQSRRRKSGPSFVLHVGPPCGRGGAAFNFVSHVGHSLYYLVQLRSQ